METTKGDIGKAIFNLQRFQILQAKLNPETSHKIPDEYAYAWYVKMYPSLEEGDFHEDLKEYFSINESQVNMVSERADSEWLEKRLYNFYEYEEFFKVRSNPVNGLDRWKLIAIFRYSFLRGGFDKPFWDKLLEPMLHPAEASSITREFKTDDLYFI